MNVKGGGIAAGMNALALGKTSNCFERLIQSKRHTKYHDDHGSPAPVTAKIEEALSDSAHCRFNSGGEDGQLHVKGSIISKPREGPVAK